MNMNDLRRWLCLRNTGILVVGLLTLSGSLRNDTSVPTVRRGSGYTYEASQPAGELALSVAARNSPVEDAWLYAGGTWTDVGVHSRKKSVQVDPNAFLTAIERWSNRSSRRARGESSTLVFYHIHPFSREAWRVEPPSTADIRALALLKQECSARTGANLVGAVMDGRGRWEFDLTPGLEHEIANHLKSAGAGHGEDVSFAAIHGYTASARGPAAFELNYPALSWAAYLPGGSISRQRRITQYISGARKLGVLVTYRSF